LGAPCTLPPTLTPVDKAYCFRQDKFVVVDESTRNNVCYDRSVLPLQVRVGLNSVITLHVYKDLLDCIDDSAVVTLQTLLRVTKFERKF